MKTQILKINLMLTILLAFGMNVFSQNEILWKKNFGGSGDDYYQSVTAVSDGTVSVGYSAATSFDNGNWTDIVGKGGTDAIIVKYNNSGNVVWKNNFGGNDNDYYFSVIAVSDGIVAVGNSLASSFGNGDWSGVTGKGNSDAIIVKYNNSGEVVWKKNFGGSGSDYFYSVTAVSDGIVAVGNSWAPSFGNGDWSGVTGTGDNDAIIVKYDNNGEVVWKKNFGGSSMDYFYSVTVVSDGIVAVGNSWEESFDTGDWTDFPTKGGTTDAIIVKYDNSGEVVWKKNFGGNGDDYFYSVIAVSDGIVTVGYSYETSFGNGDWLSVTKKDGYDAIIVKYNNNGEVVWKKNFGGSGSDYFRIVTAVSDGIIAAGYSYQTSFNTGDLAGVAGKGGYDAIIVKYNNSGNVVLKKNFGGSGYDYFYSVTAVYNSVFAAGYSQETSFNNNDWAGVAGKGNNDATIVKYELQPTDCLEYIEPLNNQITDLQTQLATANATITSLQSQLNACEKDKADLQALLDECIGSGILHIKGVSLKVYPNPVPSNGVLNVSSELLKSGDRLEIFTLSGVLVSTHIATGMENAVNIGSLPQGMYLLKFAGKNGVKFEVR